MAIEAQGLVKEYGKRRVVDRVSLEVHPGEVRRSLGSERSRKDHLLLHDCWSRKASCRADQN